MLRDLGLLTGKTGRNEAHNAAHNECTKGYSGDGTTSFGSHGAQRTNEDAQGAGIGEATNGECGNAGTASLRGMRRRKVSNNCEGLPRTRTVYSR